MRREIRPKLFNRFSGQPAGIEQVAGRLPHQAAIALAGVVDGANRNQGQRDLQPPPVLDQSRGDIIGREAVHDEHYCSAGKQALEDDA